MYVSRTYLFRSQLGASKMAEKPETGGSNSDADRGSRLGQTSVQAAKEIAALAMEGANPWQRMVVQACFGIILVSLCLVFVPPYTEMKQLVILGVSVMALVVGV